MHGPTRAPCLLSMAAFWRIGTSARGTRTWAGSSNGPLTERAILRSEGCVRSSWQQALSPFYYPSSLHNGRGVVAFADGHAETHRWLDPRTTPSVTGGILAHWNDSPGNADLAYPREDVLPHRRRAVRSSSGDFAA